MSDDKPLKSAYELAMERLNRQDRDAGVEKVQPLTDAQKKQITKLRRETEAKLAEREILFKKDVAGTEDPGKIVELEEHYRIDRRRAESSLESAIARVKRGD